MPPALTSVSVAEAVTSLAPRSPSAPSDAARKAVRARLSLKMMVQEAERGERCRYCFGFSSDLIPCVYCHPTSDRDALKDYYEEVEGYTEPSLMLRRLLDLETACKETQAAETEDRTLVVADEDGIEKKTGDW